MLVLMVEVQKWCNGDVDICISDDILTSHLLSEQPPDQEVRITENAL